MLYKERTVPEVLQNIGANIQEIVRSEFRLAKTEVEEAATKAKGAAVSLGIGAVLTFYALGFILLAAVSALSIVIAFWMAALVVGIVLAVLGSTFMSSGRKKLKHVHPVPERATETLKENVQWAKNQIK